MSEIVGEAVVRIRTDDSQVDKGLKAAGKKGGETYAGSFKEGLKGLAGAAGLAFGLDKGVGFLKEAIQGASDLNESSTKTVAIFGAATAQINKFASQGAKALGQTRQEVLDAAGTFGIFGKSAGLTGPALAKFSTGFASLSTDLASFFNTNPADAVTAIGAALRGESEPIRQYGVLLDDATLRQSALRLGIVKTTKQALTPQQRVLAAQAEIYRQTKDAQGDFQRTSSGLANQQRILRAQFIDLRTELGAKLLPVTLDVTKKLSVFVTQMQDGTGAGGEFVDVLKDTVAVGKGILDFFNGLPGPVKKYGAELLIASVVIGKVSSGLDGLIGKLKTVTITEDGVARSSFAFGAALRQAAGAGGLVLLSQGLQETDNDARTLKTTLGGAAAGFAIAGPIGGAVGALAGFTTALVTANDSATESFDSTRVAADAYAGAIDNVTGKLKDNTQASVINALQKSNPRVLQAANALGVSNEQFVRALEGSPHAIDKLNIAIRKGLISGKKFTDDLGGQARAADVLKLALNGVKGSTDENAAGQKGLLQSFRETRKEEQESAKRTRELTIALKGVPTSVATDFSDPSLPQTLGDVEKLIDTYHRTPTQIQTLVKALGIKPTKGEMQLLLDKAHEISASDPRFVVTADTSQARASLNKLLPLLQSVVRGFGAIDIPGDGKGRLQAGTDNWRGGFATVGETGRETVWLPPHSKVVSAPRTEQFLQRAGTSTVNAGAIGTEVAKALVAAGINGMTVINPVPETVTRTQTRIAANTAFLLGG